MNFQGLRWMDMDWINLVQDRKGWRALVEAVMNFQASQAGLDCMELVRNKL
jgi:hypothetical protein